MTNTEIRINIFLPDGTQSGEMTVNAEFISGVNMLKKFLKLCKQSDENGETQAVSQLEIYFTEKFVTAITILKKTAIVGTEKEIKAEQKAAEKALKLLQIVNPDFTPEQTPEEARKNAFTEKVVQDVEEISKEETEETTPPETVKGESTMKETTTNTAVQEVHEATTGEETTVKQYTAAEIQTATGFKPENVRISAHVWHHMDGTPYNVFRAAFVAGTSYKIPAKYTKSVAAEIVFTVVSNSGKSLKINILEKYNGKITEQTGKTKKLCPGGHGIWCSYDPETNAFDRAQKKHPVEFIQIDGIDITKVSRWACSRTLYAVECIPVSPEKLEAWKQNTGTATTNSAQPERKKADELDFTPVFYPVSEELARQHKHMISFDEYKTGKVTAEYQEAVKEAYELAKVSSDPEKSLYLADCYSKRLARWYDDFNRNGASCPSIMICGGGNFPVRKKEKQNARFDTLMQQYNKIKHLLEKIRKPHGWNQEIRRDTITAEEFENILYFETVINEEENRLQLVFDGKPEEAERNILKKNGFRWSPRFKAWQRQLTENAVCAVWNVVNAFDKLEEEENAEIQAETEEIKKAVPESERTAEAEPGAQPEDSAQPETTPTEADKNPTDSPEAVTAETIPTVTDNPTESPTEPEKSLTDWGGVAFEPIPDLPDPETVGTETAEAEAPPETVTIKVADLLDMLACLDRAKVKCTSAFYRGALKLIDRVLSRATGYKVYYDSIRRKHCYKDLTAPEADTSPETAKPEENNLEAVQEAETVTEPTKAEPEQPETVRFEPGKIYACISITNSDYIHAYKCISRTAKTVTFEDSRGNIIKKRPALMERYTDGKKADCETVYPDGKYSMCLVLDASELVTAETPRQAEKEHFKRQQERTRQAVQQAQRRQTITQTTTGGLHITMATGAAR